jgi:hypothetical protein
MHLRWKRARAGAIAAVVWGLLEPIDQRFVRSDYSDVAVLGKALTRGPAWRPLGFALHALNGAIFGLAYHEVARRVQRDPRRLAFELAMLEHVAFFSGGHFVDRFHPARGEPGVPPLMSLRVFAQATVRHGVFGVVLGRLSPRA